MCRLRRRKRRYPDRLDRRLTRDRRQDRLCATIVVPCGIEAIRAMVTGSFAVLVAGTLSHMPGSKWIPLAGSLVTSVIVWRYGTPLRKISPWVPDPRLGIEERLGENDRLSCVRFNSSTLSDVLNGGGKRWRRCIVGAEDRVEALADPVPGERGEWTKRGGAAEPAFAPLLHAPLRLAP